MAADRIALGEFLRSRRDRLTPAQAGVTAFPGPRRVPGLRREELAVAAGLSPDYYSRLEQGRQLNISVSVLDAIARTLRLDEVERAHLGDLANPGPARRPALTTAPQRADAGLLRLMGALDHVPVLLIGARMEILARNALLTVVVGDLAVGSSLARWLYLDPASRERIINWEYFAASTVAALRLESGRHPHDTRLQTLIDELRAADPDVASWWSDHTVRDYASGTKQIRHPVAGDLSFDIEIVSPPHEPDQRLIVYTVQADSATARMLPILASWHENAPASQPHR